MPSGFSNHGRSAGRNRIWSVAPGVPRLVVRQYRMSPLTHVHRRDWPRVLSASVMSMIEFASTVGVTVCVGSAKFEPTVSFFA